MMQSSGSEDQERSQKFVFFLGGGGLIPISTARRYAPGEDTDASGSTMPNSESLALAEVLLTLKIQTAVVKHQPCLNRVNFEMGWEKEMGWGVRWVGVGDGLGVEMGLRKDMDWGRQKGWEGHGFEEGWVGGEKGWGGRWVGEGDGFGEGYGLGLEMGLGGRLVGGRRWIWGQMCWGGRWVWEGDGFGGGR